MESTLVLRYWPLRGRAEKIRHLLEYCGLNYIEKPYRIPEDANTWFEEDKIKLAEKNPAINLPYLIDGDKYISESDAIMIYVCHKSNKVQLLGKNAEEQVMIATVYGVFKDFHNAYINLIYGQFSDEAAFQVGLKESVGKFKPYFTKLSGLLGEKDFMIGNISWVDFILADFLQTLGLMCEEYFKEFGKLVEYQKRVWELPELKKYFQSGRFKERPCNGPYAHWK